MITGGDGVPSPQKSRQPSHRITDFDDDEDESDETDNSVGSEASGSRPGNNTTTAAAAAAAAAQTGLSKLGASSASTSSAVSAANGDNDAATAATLRGGDVSLWLLDKPEALEDAYLQLTHSLGQHNQRAGRVRAAARCWGRRTELLLERGEVGVAQARLSALADLYQVRLIALLALPTAVCTHVCGFLGFGESGDWFMFSSLFVCCSLFVALMRGKVSRRAR